MKLLIQSIYYPPRLGGIENHVYNLCGGLAGRGHRVVVVTSRTEPDAPALERSENLTVRRVPIPGRHFAGWVVNALLSIPAALRSGWDADLLHAHTFQAVPPVIPLRLLRRKPLVVTLHSSHFLRMVKKPHWRAVFRLLLGPADLLLATSEELAEAARRVAPSKRIEEVVNGIDTDLFRPTAPSIPRREGRAVLVTTRRFVAKNGVRFLIDALPAILEKIPCDLYLAGIGPERRDLEERVARHGIGESVHFLGGVANRDLPPLLSAADAVVVPSLVEATSLSALEAMACERPVAASRVGGLPEIIDETCGTLFRSGDPEDLAEKVVALLRRPEEERARLGEEGRRRVVERWSVRAFVDRHEALYRRLLEGRNGG
ncbi:MAG: glycosyltransferase family 4 protein [Candidatus Eisenbacteria bacterium]